jgi:hypothetical protein
VASDTYKHTHHTYLQTQTSLTYKHTHHVLTNTHITYLQTHTSRTARGLAWRIHCGVEFTELSTNKHQYLRRSGKWCKASGKSTPNYEQAQILKSPCPSTCILKVTIRPTFENVTQVT